LDNLSTFAVSRQLVLIAANRKVTFQIRSPHKYTATTGTLRSLFALLTGRPYSFSEMAQIRGTAGYNLGLNNQFAGPGRADATNDPSPLDAIREQTSKIEDWLNTIGEPLKPLVSPSCCVLPGTLVDAAWTSFTKADRFLHLDTYLPSADSSLSSLFLKTPYEYLHNGAISSLT